MKDLFKKGLALGLGLAVASKEQIEKMVDELVKKGEVPASESKDLVSELVEKGEAAKKELNRRICEQLDKVHIEFNVPLKSDIERLEQRAQELENRLQELETRLQEMEQKLRN